MSAHNVITALLIGVASLTRTLEAAAVQVTVRDAERHTVYHSPQTPGYTSWAGIWTMLDGEVRLSFTQVTGPIGGWRQRAPKDILQRLPSAQQDIPDYDMTGLIQENVCLRSSDKGLTWTRFSSDPFSSAMNGYCVGSVVVLTDGTLLRAGMGAFADVLRGPPDGLCAAFHRRRQDLGSARVHLARPAAADRSHADPPAA
jgi:hypothetical protein